MKSHLSDNATTEGAIINPPPVQEMNSGLNKESTPLAKSSTNDEHDNLEMQPILEISISCIQESNKIHLPLFLVKYFNKYRTLDT